MLLAERLRYGYVARDFPVEETLTISLGVASYRKGHQANDILSDADDALYRAKRNGRNQVAQEKL